MIQLLEPDTVVYPVYPNETYLVPCFLCGQQGWCIGPVKFKPYIRCNGQFSLTGGSYDILYSHESCFKDRPEPLDYVLRQRGGVPHSFSLRN